MQKDRRGGRRYSAGRKKIFENPITIGVKIEREQYFRLLKQYTRKDILKILREKLNEVE